MAIASGMPYDGSIPAHAGEPLGGDYRTESREVYPRPRGGTSGVYTIEATADGLSPPTRGNRDVESPADALARSIPAHAGEP